MPFRPRTCAMFFAISFGLLSNGASLAQEPVPSYLEVRDVPHGTVQAHAYTSEALGADREVVVYTPPGYEDGADRYPVLYLLHGAGGNQTSWTERGQAHVILDNLIADGRLEPLVVVMPFGFAFQREPGGVRDRAENKVQREGFTADFFADVIPLIEANYRVIPERDQRAIAGLSLGGAQAVALGMSRTDLFSHVAGFGSALGAMGSPEVGGVDWNVILEQADMLNEGLDLLWIGCGTEDSLFESNQAFSDRLTENGVEHTFRVTRGGHNYDVWHRYLYELVPVLFR